MSKEFTMHKILIPPPIIFLLCAGIMYCLPPLLEFPRYFGWSIALIVLSGIIGSISAIQFILAKTTLHPIHLEESKTLVVSGWFKFSRNPMYLALVILLLAWAFYLGSVSAVCFIGVFVWYMNNTQIKREEHFLEQRFGQDYLEYKKKVRRWL